MAYVQYSGIFVDGILKLTSNHSNIAKEHRSERFISCRKRCQRRLCLDIMVLLLAARSDQWSQTRPRLSNLGASVPAKKKFRAKAHTI